MKRSQSIKKTVHTQLTEEKTTTLTRKVSKTLTYLVIILCGTLFYAHQLTPNFSDEYVSALSEHKAAKKKRTKALNKVKDFAKGSIAYKEYNIEREQTDLAWKKFKEAQSNERIFGFKSFNLFLERFGLMLCIFIYALYNLVKSFLREKSNIGAKVIHSFIISVTFYYFFWIFQKFQDFSKATYILMTVFSAILITVGVWFITKYNKDRISKLREQMFIIARLGIRNAKVEKKESLLKDLRKITYEK
ncbi:hypothetical protein [uncultured Tenacibaculum sp.]|uniref:hypothetical protein n=1 Tax=uncultured Tenacibaculum sp. TaxID=174713 RepID=UPI00262D5D02|nr:hypothetical protein [uncultured Tenacibaculum sp.]